MGPNKNMNIVGEVLTGREELRAQAYPIYTFQQSARKEILRIKSH